MRLNILYKITNKLNHKIYIGQCFEDRFKKRTYDHSIGCDKNSYIDRSIKKHGWENFEVEQLLVCGDQIDMYERQYIRLYDCLAPNGYNLQTGGKNQKEFTEETKKKMSIAGKEKYKNGFIHGMSGRKHSQESIKKMNKEINQFDLNNNFLKTWESLTEVQSVLKIPCSNLVRAAKRNLTAGNFKWGYN